MTILRDPVRRRSTFPTYLSKAQEAQAEKCGICILTFSVCQMFNGVQSGLVLDKKTKKHPSVLFFYHTYPLNMCVHLCQMQETGGGQGGSRVQLFNDQNHTCFLFPTCVFFPNYAWTLQFTQKRGEKKKNTSFSSLTKESSKGVGARLFFSLK